MHFRNWRILLLLFSIYQVFPASAQLPLPPAPVYAHFHSRNSDLPSELIYKIHADRNGYLWLATERGLVRYNGKEFRLIHTGPAEDFMSSCTVGDNQIWLFAYSGHTVGIDLHTQKIIPTDSLYGFEQLQPAGRVFLVGTRQGNQLMLYGNRFKGMTIIDLQHRKARSVRSTSGDMAVALLARYRFPKQWQHQLIPELAKALAENCRGFTAKDSFITIGNKIFTVDTSRPARLYFDGDDYGIEVSIIGFARRGADLFVGSLQGAGLYRIRGYFTLPRQQHQLEQLLPGEAITCIEKDYLGNIWVGTYRNGLLLFPYTEDKTLHYNKAQSGLHSEEISYIGRFPSGVTAIGYNDAIADFYQPTEQHPVQRQIATNFDLKTINNIERSAYRWLLFTRTEAFSSPMRRDGLPGNFQPVVHKGRGIASGFKNGTWLQQIFYYVSGNAIVALDTSGNISRHPATAYNTIKRTCVLPLADNDFFIGSVRGCYRNAGLLPYLKETQINAVDTVNGQLLWAGNTGVYAIPLSRASDSSLLRRIVAFPCTDLKHDYEFTYLRSADELIVIDNKTLKPVVRLSCRDFPEPFQLSAFYPDRDYLILAGNQGLFYIDRQSLHQRAAGPKARMHVLCSLNGYMPADAAFTCVYKEGLTVLFELDILDYRKEKRMITCSIFKDGKELYQEDDLKENGGITLHPNGPGQYKVVYQVTGYTGDVRKGTYLLVVTPLWYQQWWCLPLLIVLVWAALGYLLYYIFDHRAKQQRRKLEQKIYLRELEAQSLLGQLKPHFIFNILTPLQGFLVRGEKLKGLDYLDHFSGLMRGMLQGIRHRYATLSAEIEFLVQYLQVQQARYQHCFEYTIKIDPALDPSTCFIPSLLLQPLVENAIEHGIAKDRTDGRIQLFFEPWGAEEVKITITDNGAGLPSGWTLRPDHALTIITERVQLLKKTKGRGTFTLISNPDQQGTTAILILAKDNRI